MIIEINYWIFLLCQSGQR